MSARTTVLAAFAAIAAIAAPATAAAEPAPAAPLDVRLHDATCHDLSGLTETAPLITSHLQDASRTPMVRYEIRGLEQAQDRVPFEVRVDDQIRGTGNVGAGGVVTAQITVNGDAPTTVQVRSGQQVLAERVYDARC